MLRRTSSKAETWWICRVGLSGWCNEGREGGIEFTDRHCRKFVFLVCHQSQYTVMNSARFSYMFSIL